MLGRAVRERPSDEGSPPFSPSKRLKKNFIAGPRPCCSSCRRCHSKKIKCSGGKPCGKCQIAGCPESCTYEARDRKVEVNQSYLDQLLEENLRLKQKTVETSKEPTGDQNDNSWSESNEGPAPVAIASRSDQNRQNPLIGDRAWFHPYDPIAPPIYVGEAACTAFATRFRRFLSRNDNALHMPRMHYIGENELLGAGKLEVAWPSFAQAQLLVKIALNQGSRVYHMMLRKSTLAALKETYRTSQFDNRVNACKFFTLFAFGEIYSARPNSGPTQNRPGLNFYAKAIDLVRILPERPTITHIENLLLLSLFSYFLNRRHYAFVLVGDAMKLGLAIGLHQNVPVSQLIDPVERQHRVRIWWTIYIFDRMWGSKMGLPVSILDEDIHVDMPSTTLPEQEHEEQFLDTSYMIASIKLAYIAGETITKIYSRRKYEETFLQRVQKLLKSLKVWMETLPEHVRLAKDGSFNPKHIVNLHLSFNQVVILATRPTLLHVLTQQNKSQNPTVPSTQEQISQAAQTLSDACIHAAQHSHSIILQEFINGTLPTFGYFSAQYLFSSALVLAMSGLRSTDNANSDMESFETAIQVLHSMRDNGNFAATEFSQNLDGVKYHLDIFLEEKTRGTENTTGEVNNQPEIIPNSLGNGYAPPAPENDMAFFLRNPSRGFTTEMAFLEPTMQAFLAQSDLDLGHLQNPVDLTTGDASSFYFWANTPQ